MSEILHEQTDDARSVCLSAVCPSIYLSVCLFGVCLFVSQLINKAFADVYGGHLLACKAETLQLEDAWLFKAQIQLLHSALLHSHVATI